MARGARPAYVDQATGMRYDCNGGECTGWLYKQSAWLKSWRLRFMILKGSRLFFCKVKSAEQKTGHRNSLEVSTQDMEYFMYANTEKEKDDWIGAIGRAIVQSSSTYAGEEGEGESSEDEYDYR